MSAPLRLPALLLATLLALSAPLGAQLVVTPDEGTSGDVLTIEAPTDLGPKKPKVWLERPGKSPKKPLKVKLVVESVAGDRVTVELKHRKKLAPGAWDVVVKPKGKGRPEVRLAGGFTVMPPGGVSTAVEVAEPKDEVELSVEHLGAKPGSVRIWDKSVPIRGWDAATDTLRIRLPKKVPSGEAFVTVETHLGTSSLANAFTIIGTQPPVPQGDILVNGKGWTPASALHFMRIGLEGWHLLLIAADDSPSDSRHLVVDVPVPDVAIEEQVSGSAWWAQYATGVGEGQTAKGWQLTEGGALDVTLDPHGDGSIDVGVAGSIHPLVNASQPVSLAGSVTSEPPPILAVDRDPAVEIITPRFQAFFNEDTDESWGHAGDFTVSVWADVSFDLDDGRTVDALLTAFVVDSHDLADGPFTFLPEDVCILLSVGDEDDDDSYESYDLSYDPLSDAACTLELIPGSEPLLRATFAGTLPADDGVSPPLPLEATCVWTEQL